MNGRQERRPAAAPSFDMRPGGRGNPNSRANVQKPKHMKKTILRLLRYIGGSRYLLLALIVIMLAVTAAELAGPLLQGKAIDAIEPVWRNAETDEILYNYDPDDPAFADIEAKTTFTVHFWSGEYLGKDGSTAGLNTYLIAMAAIFALCALLYYLQGIFAAKLSQRTVYLLREDLFHKITRLPISYLDSHKHGDIMSRMTNDVENVSNAVSQSVTSLCSALLTVVGAAVMMLMLSPLMTLVALVTVPVSIFVSAKLGKFMRKYFVRQQRLLGALNGTVEEMVTSYETVVAYGKESDAVAHFSGISGELRGCAVSARVWGSIMGPVMNFIGNLQYVMLAAVGGALILFGGPGSISIGNIQSMLSYSKKFTRPINQIANQYSTILTALAGAERIFEIMDNANEIDAGCEDVAPEQIVGNIEFSDIHFHYVEGEPVLKGLNLSVKAGQKVAIVGATGSGKTTVVNLLTRFYEVARGSITVDGIDVRDMKKSDLRHAIAIVLQDTVLFRDTIRNNIKYARPDATDEEMREAARHARASTFIERLPQGYDTVLEEEGSNLSEGQRQLLAIARAVLADPKILILDEATSSVDTRTEMKIQQAMVALMKNRTSLIIAHRLSTIRDADKIVVVKGGVIAEEGSHDELLALGGEYAKLYQNQFAGIAT